MGSGYKQFTAGAVLTASEVNNYLMEQSVMTFAGSAARGSAIGTANYEEGMTSYLQDTDKLEVYNGTNWVSVAPTSTQGLTLINTTSFSGVTSQSFNNVFNATYDNYRIMFNNIINVSTGGVISIRMRASGTDNTSNNYMRQYASFNNTTISGARATNQTSWQEVCYTNTNNDKNAWIDIYSPFNTQYTNALQMGNDNGSSFILFINQAYGLNVNTSYDGFTVINSQSMTGSVSVYGYNK
jgi:hypothetical protein